MSWSQANERLKSKTYVKSDVGPHEAKVAPMMAIENIRVRLQEFVCGPERAELATARGVRIRDVAGDVIDVSTEILLTSLTRGWFDCQVFDGCAGDLRVPDR